MFPRKQTMTRGNQAHFLMSIHYYSFICIPIVIMPPPPQTTTSSLDEIFCKGAFQVTDNRVLKRALGRSLHSSLALLSPLTSPAALRFAMLACFIHGLAHSLHFGLMRCLMRIDGQTNICAEFCPFGVPFQEILMVVYLQRNITRSDMVEQ